MSRATFLVQGGPGDGAHVPRANYPNLADGQEGQLCLPDNLYRAGIYRRQGDVLVYQRSVELYRFKGGVLDGSNYPVSEVQPGKTKLLFKLNSGRCALYALEGKDLVYKGDCDNPPETSGGQVAATRVTYKQSYPVPASRDLLFDVFGAFALGSEEACGVALLEARRIYIPVALEALLPVWKLLLPGTRPAKMATGVELVWDATEFALEGWVDV